MPIHLEAEYPYGYHHLRYGYKTLGADTSPCRPYLGIEGNKHDVDNNIDKQCYCRKDVESAKAVVGRKQGAKHVGNRYGYEAEDEYLKYFGRLLYVAIV
jgi:hypothetical protein